MSERSELFFPEEKYIAAASIPAKPAGYKS